MVLTAAVLAISLSIDALGVGIAYGIRKVKIPLLSKMIICAFSILYTGIAMIVGESLGKALQPEVSKLIGVVILLVMGLWIIGQGLLKKEKECRDDETLLDKEKTLLKLVVKSFGITIHVIKNPVKGDVDKSGVIDAGESILLGLALSVDAIGVGVGSSLAGFRSMLIPFAVGVFQLLFLYTGTYLGEKILGAGKVNKKLLAVLPGVILVLIGIIRAV